MSRIFFGGWKRIICRDFYGKIQDWERGNRKVTFDRLMKSFDEKKVSYFQKEILSWFEQNGREFPWRNDNLSSYELVIAEVLLQRTRAETVSKRFQSFIDQFSSWKAIDKVGQSRLEEELKPFGLYKQKGERLKNLASEMVKRGGNLPLVREDLEEIPLVGQYIASAVISYVHNQEAPLLDVNMARVLERFFGPRELADIRYDPYLQELSETIVKHPKHKEINWAILDFASLICKKRNPICEECLLSDRCRFYNTIP